MGDQGVARQGGKLTIRFVAKRKSGVLRWIVLERWLKRRRPANSSAVGVAAIAAKPVVWQRRLRRLLLGGRPPKLDL
jgi:hypothetical protein